MNLDKFVSRLRAVPAPPDPEPEYVCAACKDTGWIETDDGLENGRRVRAPVIARCTSVIHERKPVPSEPTPERFS